MVNLKANPYFLSDEDVTWVESTIASMTDEEKVGQLFFQLMAGQSEEYLSDLMERFHLGGCRYNNMPGKMVQDQNRILQKYAKVPVFIACNTEAGSKAHCIAEMLKFGYAPDHVLMVGDAPGDCDAAEKNGVWYYPILVNSEQESWIELRESGLDRLKNLTFSGEYQQAKKRAFLENLGG